MITLHTTYFGPIQWYQQLYRSEGFSIDTAEPYIKQSTRNHCLIAGPNGIQKLTVPVSHPKLAGYQPTTSQIRISSHGNWQRQHWHALQTAYGDSPFFIYYEDDLRPFFTEEPPELLTDFNASIVSKMCELLDIQPIDNQQPTISSPQTTPYYQVFRERYGFQSNLSILDLLFNMGNEAILYL